MRYFVTGASGLIGTATTAALLARGHDVVGLARSDASAARIDAAGADVLRGDLSDLDTLRRGALDTDGVIHLAFIHDFTDPEAAVGADRVAVDTLVDALAGTGKPLTIASGALGVAPPGHVATELDRPEGGPGLLQRQATAGFVLSAAERGVRSSIVRLAPTVHGAADLHGFIPMLIELARDKGVAGYPADGENRWPAVHVDDAAELFALAIESAPAGSALHGIAEPGLPSRAIAEAIGQAIGVPARSIAPEEMESHFGWIGHVFAIDAPTSNALTREWLGWDPSGPTLFDDLASGAYASAAV